MKDKRIKRIKWSKSRNYWYLPVTTVSKNVSTTTRTAIYTAHSTIARIATPIRPAWITAVSPYLPCTAFTSISTSTATLWSTCLTASRRTTALPEETLWPTRATVRGTALSKTSWTSRRSTTTHLWRNSPTTIRTIYLIKTLRSTACNIIICRAYSSQSRLSACFKHLWPHSWWYK